MGYLKVGGKYVDTDLHVARVKVESLTKGIRHQKDILQKSRSESAKEYRRQIIAGKEAELIAAKAEVARLEAVANPTVSSISDARKVLAIRKEIEAYGGLEVLTTAIGGSVSDIVRPQSYQGEQVTDDADAITSEPSIWQRILDFIRALIAMLTGRAA